MNFAEYLNQAWQDHATNAEKVSREFSTGLSLIETNEQLVQLSGLVMHVMGEHLGRWNEGISVLESLKKLSSFIPGSETEKTVARSIASLQIRNGQIESLNSFELSDQIRILAVAGSALSERDTKKSKDLLLRALDLAQSGLEKSDPANRALAVTGNNLACALEEKKFRSSEETELMVLAAKIGRTYWERTGTWLEVSRAEYRLAISYLEAEQVSKALEHAQICVELCRENNASDTDMFYAYEALARVERERANQLGFHEAVETAKTYFDKLNPDDKSWCESSLKKLV